MRSPFRRRGRLLTLSFAVFLAFGDIASVLGQPADGLELQLGIEAGIGWGGAYAGQDIPVYSLSPTCGTFGSVGVSHQRQLGLVLHFPSAFNNSLGFLGLLSLGKSTETFLADPLDPQYINDPDSDDIIQLDRVYRLEQTSDALNVTAAITHQVSRLTTLLAGVRVGYKIANSIRETDEVRGPDGLRFSDGRSEHDIEQGPVLLARRASFGPTVGLFTTHTIGRRLQFRPSIRIETDLFDGSESFGWISARPMISFGLHYDMTKYLPAPQSPDPTLIPPPAPVIPPPTAGISIVGFDQEGHEQNVSYVQSRTVRTERTVPLLPRIFFDSGSADIPHRYDRGVAGSVLPDTASIVLAQHLLPAIIASRLAQNRDASIEVSGHHSSDEADSIGRMRAASASHRIQSLGARAEQIDIVDRTIETSDESREMGREENRTAFISGEPPQILGAYTFETVSREFTPPSISIKPTYSSVAGIAEWNSTITHGGQVMARYSSADTGAEQSERFSWTVRMSDSSDFIEPLVASFEVMDSLGQRATAYDTIPIRFRSDESRTDLDVEKGPDVVRRTRWITGFDFNAHALPPAARAELNALVEMCDSATGIRITGYTDITGQESHNERLSLMRAQTVGAYMREKLADRKTSIRYITAEGAGVDSENFPNTLPEGRLLSRGVAIEIETMIPE